MKKILFIVDEFIPYYNLFVEAATKQNIELHIVLYDQIVFQISHKGTIVSWNQADLQSFDLVYFRTIGNNLEKQILIADYCYYHQIRILDEALAYKRPWIGSKALQYVRLSENQLPLIPSYYCTSENVHSFESELIFPIVVKTSQGSKGEGVHLCYNMSQVEKIYDLYKKDLILQKYIQSSFDIRVFVVGDKVVATMKRESSSPSEFRHNISLGGNGKAFDIPAEASQVAIRTTQALEYSISGVDLILDSDDNNWRILEINRSPQLGGIMDATRTDIPWEIISYFSEELNQ